MNVAVLEPRRTQLSPELEYYDRLHKEKCRDKEQHFHDHCEKTAFRLSNSPYHEAALTEMLYNRRFLPAGRVQAALGAREREVSPFNCSVSQKIEDNMDSIMGAATNAAKILRLGTGIGYNFSHIRPMGALIKKLQTEASGPVSFMQIFEAVAGTIASSGHRRGAQMGILNVSHPDIELFIDAKLQKGTFRHFNLSVGITDEFMSAVNLGIDYALRFEGETYKVVNARDLWNKIIRNAYDSAEPGIIFIDRLNANNNLHYCETMEATNPCAEQPLPPYGLCCLGSFNLAGYIYGINNKFHFNYDLFEKDVRHAVRAYDNIFDDAVYAIAEHAVEAKSKRRIGLGFTGIASAIELMLGRPSYGDADFCEILADLASKLTYIAYDESAELAKEKGAFPLYDKRYLDSVFIKSLPVELQEKIAKHGIRNSHLISYAPCGTISQYAGNVSSGVEPIFYHKVQRDVFMANGLQSVILNDFNVRRYGFMGRTLDECSVDQHLNVASTIARYTDSAISKTVNVATGCSYDEYEQIYRKAFEMGLKGITVFRPTALRGVVIAKAEEEKPLETIFGSCSNGACTL